MKLSANLKLNNWRFELGVSGSLQHRECEVHWAFGLVDVRLHFSMQREYKVDSEGFYTPTGRSKPQLLLCVGYMNPRHSTHESEWEAHEDVFSVRNFTWEEGWQPDARHLQTVGVDPLSVLNLSITHQQFIEGLF